MQGQSSLLSAGSVPAGWLVSKRAMATTYYGTTVAWNYGMAASLQQLDLAHNHLTGSLPADANLAFGVTAELVLDPMDAGFGLCGPIPSNILASVVSSDTCAKASQQSCNGTSRISGSLEMCLHHEVLRSFYSSMHGFRWFAAELGRIGSGADPKPGL